MKILVKPWETKEETVINRYKFEIYELRRDYQGYMDDLEKIISENPRESNKYLLMLEHIKSKFIEIENKIKNDLQLDDLSEFKKIEKTSQFDVTSEKSNELVTFIISSIHSLKIEIKEEKNFQKFLKLKKPAIKLDNNKKIKK